MPRSILVVDDEAEIRDLAVAVLSSGGYAPRSAASGRRALEEIVRERPDLVLLDVNMPDMDGWEVLRLLKAAEAYRDLPVAMFTVKSEIRDKVHALQDGALDYITKPFGADELVGRIERIFSAIEAAR